MNAALCSSTTPSPIKFGQLKLAEGSTARGPQEVQCDPGRMYFWSVDVREDSR